MIAFLTSHLGRFEDINLCLCQSCPHDWIWREEKKPTIIWPAIFFVACWSVIEQRTRWIKFSIQFSFPWFHDSPFYWHSLISDKTWFTFCAGEEEEWDSNKLFYATQANQQQPTTNLEDTKIPIEIWFEKELEKVPSESMQFHILNHFEEKGLARIILSSGWTDARFVGWDEQHPCHPPEQFWLAS